MVEQVGLTNKSWSCPALPSTGVHCRSPGATGTCTCSSQAHKAGGWKKLGKYWERRHQLMTFSYTREEDGGWSSAWEGLCVDVRYFQIFLWFGNFLCASSSAPHCHNSDSRHWERRLLARVTPALVLYFTILYYTIARVTPAPRGRDLATVIRSHKQMLMRRMVMKDFWSTLSLLLVSIIFQPFPGR